MGLEIERWGEELRREIIELNINMGEWKWDWVGKEIEYCSVRKKERENLEEGKQ